MIQNKIVVVIEVLDVPKSITRPIVITEKWNFEGYVIIGRFFNKWPFDPVSAKKWQKSPKEEL